MRLSAFGLVVLLCAAPAHALTADELARKYVEARGGLATLQAIGSVRFSGRYDDGSGVEIRVNDMRKRPGALRQEVLLQGFTEINAYDGKEAWRVWPYWGRKDPERVTADDAKWMVEESDLEGPLVNYKAKGHAVEYLGTEDVDGTAAHKLKLTRKNGDVQFIYLDPDYFLQIRTLTQRRVRGVLQEEEADFGEYEQVDGVWFPLSIQSGPKGAARKPTVIIEKVEVNVPLDDALFRFPSTAPAGK